MQEDHDGRNKSSGIRLLPKLRDFFGYFLSGSLQIKKQLIIFADKVITDLKLGYERAKTDSGCDTAVVSRAHAIRLLRAGKVCRDGGVRLYGV